MINCIHLKCFTYEEQRLGQATVKYSIFKHKNQLSKKIGIIIIIYVEMQYISKF